MKSTQIRYIPDGSMLLEKLPPGLNTARSVSEGADTAHMAVRAFINQAIHSNGSVSPVIPQTDLIRLMTEFSDLHLIFSRTHATVVSTDWKMLLQLPVVFVEGVGLKCFDLRQTDWTFQEESDELLAATAA